MKKVILILLIASSLLAKAQFIQSVSIKGGMSSAIQSWQYTNSAFAPDMSLKYRNGLYGAVSLEFLKSKYFSLITDIGYCEKGRISDYYNFRPITNPEIFTTITMYEKFEFLTLSQNLKLKYSTTHWIPYLSFGIRVDYNIAYSSDGDKYFFHWRGYDIVENDYKKTLFGINLGAGVEYKIKQFGVFSDFQYQYDLTKFYSTDYLTIKNRSFIFSLGVKYYFETKSK